MLRRNCYNTKTIIHMNFLKIKFQTFELEFCLGKSGGGVYSLSGNTITPFDPSSGST